MAGAGGGGGQGILDIYDKNQEATIYVGNVDQKIDEEILWELFVNCGPLHSVNCPKDKITQMHMGYGFIEFKNEDDADYAIKVMNMVKLFGKPIRCSKATADKKTADCGANLFIGNVDPSCDDKTLYDTFAAFGQLLCAKVMRDPDTGESRGFAFVGYDTFEASDAAMEAMNGQFLCNSPIAVSYAYKKDTKGERHGDAAERLLAANKPAGAEEIEAPATLTQKGFDGKGGGPPAPPGQMGKGGKPGGGPPPPPGFSKGGKDFAGKGNMPMGGQIGKGMPNMGMPGGQMGNMGGGNMGGMRQMGGGGGGPMMGGPGNMQGNMQMGGGPIGAPGGKMGKDMGGKGFFGKKGGKDMKGGKF